MRRLTPDAPLSDSAAVAVQRCEGRQSTDSTQHDPSIDEAHAAAAGVLDQDAERRRRDAAEFDKARRRTTTSADRGTEAAL